MKRLYIIFSLLFFTLFLAWKLLFESHLTQRIPRDWSFEAEYLGNLVFADDKGQVHAQKNLTLYQRYWRVLEWQVDSATIEDIYKTIDVQSGEVTWETRLLFHVDSRNGKIIGYENHPEAKGRYYIFPQDVQQKDYDFFNYDLYPYTMQYQRTELREGITLYVFSFQGTINYTELFNLAYLTPDASPLGDYQIQVDNFYREMWVEPVTGEIIHIIEDDPGDYLVDPISGDKERLYDIWSGKTTGNTVKHLLNRAKKRRWQIHLYRQWIPAVFLSGALFFLALALFSQFKLNRRCT